MAVIISMFLHLIYIYLHFKNTYTLVSNEIFNLKKKAKLNFIYYYIIYTLSLNKINFGPRKISTVKHCVRVYESPTKVMNYI